MHRYSTEEIDYLRQISYGRTDKEITKKFNKKFGLNLSESAIKATRRRYGIKTGRTGRFEKGHKPWNKGMKGLKIGGEETQFRKGHIPDNHRPVGSERICSKDGYVLIKTEEPDVWEHKHRVVWEREHGPIPEGHVIIFGDGDRTNLDINNLILISKKQLLGLNRRNLIQNHAELTKTAVKIVDLEGKIAERIREGD